MIRKLFKPFRIDAKDDFYRLPYPHVPTCEIGLETEPLIEIEAVKTPVVETQEKITTKRSSIKVSRKSSRPQMDLDLTWFYQGMLKSVQGSVKLINALQIGFSKGQKSITRQFKSSRTRFKKQTASSRKTTQSTRSKRQASTLTLPQFKIPQFHLPRLHLRAKLAQAWLVLVDTFKLSLKFTTLSFAIFLAGFLILNYQAYWQIFGAWWENQIQNHSGQFQSNLVAMHESFEPPPVPLKINKDPNVEKTRIPPLHLSIAPPDNRIIVPRLGKSVPLVETQANYEGDWTAFSEAILTDLQGGVVRYPGTAKPGQKGNVFVTGHSSYYPWDPGQYKDVFARLPQVEIEDQITIYYHQKRYDYQVIEKKEVKPTALDVLKQSDDYRLSVMTCTPVGTDLKRLIVIATQV